MKINRLAWLTAVFLCVLAVIQPGAGAAGDDDVKKLIADLASGERGKARTAAAALGAMKGGASEAIGPLFDAFEDGGPMVKAASLTAIVEITKENDGILVRELLKRPQLGARLRGEEKEDGRLSEAREKLRGESVRALSGEAKRSSDSNERRRSIEMIGEMADDDPETREVLERARQDPDEKVRAAADEALAKVEGRADVKKDDDRRRPPDGERRKSRERRRG